jgi:hypothetical protein
MSQKQRTRSKNYEAVEKQVDEFTPESVIDAIAVQIDRAHEAAERIEKEGSVVRDMKGSVIPHPAISIEQSATKIYTDLLKKWCE